ncbi:hypothetical protein SBA4_2460007 [Candidatus Sulfopaludibacter sp. SbA4]|nr:hypothetical protein SBA4_2460007 [Candidatus Sulfopaludibacter sp. SbA4]
MLDRQLARYSCAGICCSISRHALIFKRRHTQQSGSPTPLAVSAPHTEQTGPFFRLSGEIDRFACSRISGEITGSGFGCAFRLIMLPNPYLTMAETVTQAQLPPTA